MEETGKLVSVDDYIQGLPAEVKPIFKKVRAVVHNVLPEAAEVISYGVPTLKLNGSYVVYFAGYKKHIGIYPVPSDEHIQKEIAPYRAGKGTLQFPIDKPIPFELIDKVTRALLKDNRQRAKK